ncbi:hypothetical protein T492DRAFT_1151227 [Pavlovales sp. CCMP2436]|nr:hypothetical protein T492DRAFT_1151227 [Pavlovales sp. CCMP2436]
MQKKPSPPPASPPCTPSLPSPCSTLSASAMLAEMLALGEGARARALSRRHGQRDLLLFKKNINEGRRRHLADLKAASEQSARMEGDLYLSLDELVRRNRKERAKFKPEFKPKFKPASRAVAMKAGTGAGSRWVAGSRAVAMKTGAGVGRRTVEMSVGVGAGGRRTVGMKISLAPQGRQVTTHAANPNASLAFNFTTTGGGPTEKARGKANGKGAFKVGAVSRRVVEHIGRLVRESGGRVGMAALHMVPSLDLRGVDLRKLVDSGRVPGVTLQGYQLVLTDY